MQYWIAATLAAVLMAGRRRSKFTGSVRCQAGCLSYARC